MKNYRICLLNDCFYSKYPNSKFPELLSKGDKRPYLILLLRIKNKNFGIPFRSHINHKYCFKIINDRNLKEGLDYTKAVVISESDISRSAHVRTGSLPQIDKHIGIIYRDFSNFLTMFVNVKSKTSKLTKNEKQLLEMTTLKYFL